MDESSVFSQIKTLPFCCYRLDSIIGWLECVGLRGDAKPATHKQGGI